MSYWEIGLLHSRSRSQQNFKVLISVCPDDIFLFAEPFTTKLGMVMHHHEPDLGMSILPCKPTNLVFAQNTFDTRWRFGLTQWKVAVLGLKALSVILILELTSYVLLQEHLALQDMAKHIAEYRLLQEVSRLPTFGYEFHEVRSAHGDKILFGVGPEGLLLKNMAENVEER